MNIYLITRGVSSVAILEDEIPQKQHTIKKNHSNFDSHRFLMQQST